MPVIIGPQSIKDMMAEKIIKKTGCYQTKREHRTRKRKIEKARNLESQRLTNSQPQREQKGKLGEYRSRVIDPEVH